MNALERIGGWLRPLARGMGVAGNGVTIEKSAPQIPIESSSDLYDVIWGSGVFQDVHPILAYRLYLKSDVLGTAVHRIAHAIAGFTLGLTTDDQDFNDVDPVIDFLDASSEGYSKRRFFYELATSYLLTNEAWIVLRGRPERPPVSRSWVYPFDVIDHGVEYDGIPTAFRTVGDRDRRTYRREDRRGAVRFIAEDGLNELVPILGAEAVDRPFRGQSPVAPLLYSVQQNVEGKRHNTSVLRNELRLTGAIMPPEGDRFDDAALVHITNAIRAMRGAASAGGTLVMPRRVDTLDLSLSNREMDYVELLREAKDAVYTYYKIPLPLVSNDAATFNNFSTALTAFYDFAVFPVFDDIADALTSALLSRFPSLDRHWITYNENTIKALRTRNIERMRDARGTSAMSTNEIREMGGYAPVEFGDDVLIPSSLVKLGDDGMELPTTVVAPIDDDDDEPDDELVEDEEVEDNEEGDGDVEPDDATGDE